MLSTSISPFLTGSRSTTRLERQVFSGDTAATERIYQLSQGVIDVLRNSTPLNRLTQTSGSEATKYAIPDELRESPTSRFF